MFRFGAAWRKWYLGLLPVLIVVQAYAANLVVRNIAMHFDAYLPEQLRSGKQMFSKTV